ncbi:MAG TPA: hypothetical protein VFN83_02275 [Gemmatimonadales bacterium]|jgi:hypothetical protein|nr:hypothetical protein [Gemmatimonadales bacterium]
MLHEVPQNGGYMIAAYIVTAVILVGYWVRLGQKIRREHRVSGARKVSP